MERKLEAIFDYQRFSPNSHLAAIISDTEMRYGELSEEELSLVAAAGEQFQVTELTHDNHQHLK